MDDEGCDVVLPSTTLQGTLFPKPQMERYIATRAGSGVQILAATSSAGIHSQQKHSLSHIVRGEIPEGNASDLFGDGEASHWRDPNRPSARQQTGLLEKRSLS